MKKLLFCTLGVLLCLSSAFAGDTLNLRIDDMHCGKCAHRIKGRLAQVEGIDSVATHTLRHYITVSYDGNKTNGQAIRAAISELGFTPVSYFKGEDYGYAYFLLPEGAANEETVKKVSALQNVCDVNVSPKRKALALTYRSKETDESALLKAINALGIEATLPEPHVCKDK